MKRVLSLVTIFLLLTSQVLAETPAKSPYAIFQYPAKASTGITVTDGRTLFYIDYLIPLCGDKYSLLFLNPKVVWGSNATDEQNIGCGYRQLLFDDNLMLGCNFYYDTRRSENDFRYHQIGAGLEAFIREWIDLRGNFYFPLSEKKHLKDTVTYTFGQRSLIAWTTTYYEEPLMGLDYEAGVLIPIISDFIETRYYMGGYHYFSDLGDDIHGISARIEVRPTQSLVIDLQMRSDKVFGTDVYAGAYISLPFSLGNLLTGKNPFKGWKDSISFCRGARKPRQRMTDMVIRDIDITSQEGTITPTQEKEHDVTFVDDSNTSGTEDGTYDYPYPSVGDGITNATGDKWVYVRQGSGSYVENVELDDNVVLWGAGYNGGFKGIPAPGYPVIDGGASGDVITLGTNNTIMGLQIQNSGGSLFVPCGGIYALGTGTGAHIHHNIITNNYLGIRFHNNSNTTVSGIIINNNTISNTETTAISFNNSSSGSINNITFKENTYTGNSISDILIMNTSSTASISNVVISGENITGAIISIYIYDSYGAGISDVSILNNTISPSTTGLEFDGGTLCSITDVTVSGNTISGGSLYGIFITPYSEDDTILVKIQRNIITNNSNGIYVGSQGGGTITCDLGGGSLGSEGYNSIYDNTNYDVNNTSTTEVSAQYNWWGTVDPDEIESHCNGDVDYTPYLSSDPN